MKDHTLETLLGDKLRLRAFERVMECMRSPDRRIMRSDALYSFDGEE